MCLTENWVGRIVGKVISTISLRWAITFNMNHATYFAKEVCILKGFFVYAYIRTQDLFDLNYEEGKEEEIIYSNREMCPTEN